MAQINNKNVKIKLPLRKQIAADIQGAVLLEFAFILPVFALLLFGVIEFGWYFVRWEALTRAVGVIELNPTLYTQTSANGTASGIISFGTNGNYICAQSYQNNPNPNGTPPANPYCGNGTWQTGATSCINNPVGEVTGSAGTCTTPYYVGIVAHAAALSLTGFSNSIMPYGTSISEPAVVAVGGSSGSGSGGLPVCTAVGQTLTWNGTGFVCANGSGGSVGGGCSAYWVTGADNTQFSPFAWGNATVVWNGNFNCTCPAGYTLQNNGSGTFPTWNQGSDANNYEEWLCLKN